MIIYVDNYAAQVENISGPSTDPTLGAHGNDTPPGGDSLPEASGQNPNNGVAGAEQNDAFPSSTLAAILGNDAGPPAERPARSIRRNDRVG